MKATFALVVLALTLSLVLAVVAGVRPPIVEKPIVAEFTA
jgi:hypothetical protein